MNIEPQHFSFCSHAGYPLRFDPNNFGVSIVIGKVDGYCYRDSIDKFTYTVNGSNKAYEYLLHKFWRYVGAA